MNRRQLKLFRQLHGQLNNMLDYNVAASLANSAGLFLGTDYAFEMVRPGIGFMAATRSRNRSAISHSSL